jgi:hypothetical protein
MSAKDMLGVAVRKLVTLPGAVLGIVCDLLEKCSDPEWVEATKRFLRKEEPWPKPQTVNLGSGFIFTIDEIVELEVDYSTEPDEILRRGGHNSADWKHLGTKPEPGTRRVRAAIGRLNRSWTEEQIMELLEKPNCPMKGSGAWVREAFLKARSRYDGKGWIGFPDAETSRWRSRSGGRVCFPGLWGDVVDWFRSLPSVRREWRAGSRLCLLFAE